jgi:hypothetical protein
MGGKGTLRRGDGTGVGPAGEVGPRKRRGAAAATPPRRPPPPPPPPALRQRAAGIGGHPLGGARAPRQCGAADAPNAAPPARQHAAPPARPTRRRRRAQRGAAGGAHNAAPPAARTTRRCRRRAHTTLAARSYDACGGEAVDDGEEGVEPERRGGERGAEHPLVDQRYDDAELCQVGDGKAFLGGRVGGAGSLGGRGWRG